MQKNMLKNSNKLANSVKCYLQSCPLIPYNFIKVTFGLIIWRIFLKNCSTPEIICELTFWRFTKDDYKKMQYKKMQYKKKSLFL